MSVVVMAEGDVDRAVVQAIAPGMKVLIPKDQATGREAATRRAALTAKQVDSREILLMLDWNTHTEDQLVAEVTRVLEKNWERRGLEPTDRRWTYDDLRSMRLVLAGTPADQRLKAWGVDRFMADDYLLALCLRDDSLSAFCDGERHLTWIPQDAASLEALLVELAEVFGKRGTVLSSSKRYIHLIRAAIGFEASRATFAEVLIKRAPETARSEVLGDLRRQLTGS
jgi:hypothetical protein